MELYLIRHAQSYNNTLPGEVGRVADPRLTELGRNQAEHLAKHLATAAHPEQLHGADPEDTHVRTVTGYRFARLYCSAMHRSLTTATIVGRAMGIRPEIWTDIHESGGIFLDHGPSGGVVAYPGLTRSEIREEFPEVVIGDDVREEGWWDPLRGQEDWPTCQGRAIRVSKTLWRMAASSDPGPIALISHAGFMEALIKALLGRLPASELTFYHFNTAITRLDLDAPDEVSIRYMNRVPHLPLELIS
ncbi:MAG: histidine phosphatase family protein [Spirochaetota bacterium]